MAPDPTASGCPDPARRRWLRAVPLALSLGLTRCGWQPVYAPSSGTAVAADLAAIEVRAIPERDGQLLRQALQAEFGRSGSAVSHRYDLAAWISIGGESIGTRQDYSTSRIRYVARAGFTLTADRPSHHTLSTGIARAMDGETAFDEQYFASALEEEAIHRRLAAVVAQQIALQLAAFFHRQAAGAG